MHLTLHSGLSMSVLFPVGGLSSVEFCFRRGEHRAEATGRGLTSAALGSPGIVGNWTTDRGASSAASFPVCFA